MQYQTMQLLPQFPEGKRFSFLLLAENNLVVSEPVGLKDGDTRSGGSGDPVGVYNFSQGSHITASGMVAYQTAAVHTYAGHRILLKASAFVELGMVGAEDFQHCLHSYPALISLQAQAAGSLALFRAGKGGEEFVAVAFGKVKILC